MDRHDWVKLLTRTYTLKPNKTKKFNPYLDIRSEATPAIKNKVEISETNSNTENVDADHKESVKNGKVKSKEKLSLIKQEEVNHFRNVNNINVNGTDVPHPIETFEKLTTEYNVNSKILENLVSERYERPTPVQMQVWSLLFKRREVMACAPTGSGKTAAFLLPVIHQLKYHRSKGFRAIILAPTRELANQIVRECDRLAEGTGLKSYTFSKSSSSKNLFKKCDILVTTPNKLVYILQEEEAVRKICEKVEWLIVDESDKLFESGKNGFRDQLAALFKACSGPNVLRAMFSATFSFDVEEWCKMNLNNVVRVTIGTRNTCPDVEQHLCFCASNEGKMMEIHNMFLNGYGIPCLIFVQTKERAKILCNEILLTNRPVRCIHSDMSKGKRDNIVKEFREKKIWILICTELMCRGIDFKGVNLVINYDFPPSIVSYIHRIGRTGRASKKGNAVTFWSLEDRPLLRSIAHVMKDSGSVVDDWILNLKNTSTRDRKKFAQKMPDRGSIYDGMKDKRGNRKRKSNFENENMNKKKKEGDTDTSEAVTENDEKENNNINKSKKKTEKNNKSKKGTKKNNNSQKGTENKVKERSRKKGKRNRV